MSYIYRNDVIFCPMVDLLLKNESDKYMSCGLIFGFHILPNDRFIAGIVEYA